MPTPITALLTAVADPTNELRVPVAGHARVGATWGFQGRILDDHLIYVVTRGSFRAAWPGVDRTIDTGTCLYLPAGIRHDFTQPRDRFTVIHLRLLLKRNPAGQVPILLAPSPLLEAVASETRDECAWRDDWSPWRVRAACLRLLTAIVTAAAHPADGLSLDELDRLRRHVARNIAFGVSPGDLATEIGRSPVSLARRMRRSLGVAPRRWLVQERVRLLGQALVEDAAGRENLDALARRYGFGDGFRLSKQFKQVTGLSPSRWRRLHGGPTLQRD